MTQLMAEMRTEEAAAERLNNDERLPARWRAALGRDIKATIDRLHRALVIEQNRPTKESQ